MQVNNLLNKIASLLLVLSLFACQFSGLTVQSYLKYINDPSNGLIKQKEVGGYALSVKYLPTDYLVYRELESQGIFTKETVDSTKAALKSNMTFILRLAPSEDQSFDVMSGNVMTEKEQYEQNYTANFDLIEYISLKIDGKSTLNPVLVRMENTYGTTDHRNINIVFSNSKEIQEAKELDLIFDDPLFNTGKHHFVFYHKHISNTPLLKF